MPKKIKSDALFVVMMFISFIFFVSSTEANTDRAMKGREYKTMDLISNIDTYNINDERLRLDSAKAHYNMGNIYFYKGEYEIAAREYYQAVTLMPNDPDAHYNLAFVSGQYLKDYQTALKHYRMYLYLNPKSKDRPFVNEKIIEAEMAVKGKTKSILENEEESVW